VVYIPGGVPSRVGGHIPGGYLGGIPLIPGYTIGRIPLIPGVYHRVNLSYPGYTIELTLSNLGIP